MHFLFHCSPNPDFLKREYLSQTGERLVLMKCIDFYHSKELTQLVKRYKAKQ